MCGIAGLLRPSGALPHDNAMIRAMTNALHHRGPDGEGFFFDDGLAFGHRRLSIIDLGGGAQPMSLPGGGPTITFNGEIYNFQSLREDLIAKGAVFKTNSDTEVLLHGWRLWREDMLHRLKGMFAFAIWDPSENCLFLARDRFGKKPLHFTWLDDGTFAFSSEIKSLFKLAGLNRTLDAEAVNDFFAFGYIADPKTIFKSVKKLSAGHFLRLEKGGEPQIRRYWDIAEAALDYADAPATEEEVRDRLQASVGHRLVSDVEVGAFLSGGVDSSSVVALMSQTATKTVNTFSIGFQERQFDESEYAAAVAERYNTNHRALEVTADGFSLLDELPRIFDEPFGDSSAIPTYYVCQQTAQFVKVCLSGDGGDEMLAGYRRYPFHLMGERMRSVLPDFIRMPLFKLAGDLYPKLDWAPRFLRAKTTFQEYALDAPGAYFRILAALPGEARAQIFSNDFKPTDQSQTPEGLVRDLFNAHEQLNPLQRAQYVDANLYLTSDILTKVDRTSMANSLEVRAPLLDHDFAAWAFALPSRVKVDGSNGKAILKSAMEPLLSKDILYRPKQGFSIPLTDWLRGPFKARVENLSRSEYLADCGFFDLSRIASLIQSNNSGRQDHTMALWLLLVFEGFLKHIAQQQPASIEDSSPVSAASVGGG